jgi:hypothetical protein
VTSVLERSEFHELFNLPLFEEAFEEFCELQTLVQALPANGVKDIWSYIWGNGVCSTSKAYKHLIGAQAVHSTFS